MKKYPKNITAANIALMLAIVIGGIAYYSTHHLAVKTVASLLFVALGIVNWLYVRKAGHENKGFAFVMVVALFFAMLGDVVLEINFMGGALIFAVGHVFYFLAYCRLIKLEAKDLIPSACIFVFAAALILFLPIFDFGGIVMQIVCLVYALIIACMLGKAFSNCRKKLSVLSLLLLMGSFWFFFSDMMLLFSHFADVPRIMGLLCVNTYYPAQAILGYAVLRSADR